MIYIVTGLARTGTAMMARMLQAGGIELSYDKDFLHPNVGNEYGYFEYRNPGDLLCNPVFRDSIDGMAIKVVNHQLVRIPFAPRRNMRAIWMQRRPEPTWQSWERHQRKRFLLDWNEAIFQKQTTRALKELRRELETFDAYIEFDYEDVIYRPRPAAARLQAFTGREDFDVEAAARIPEERLCHFR